MGRNGVGTSPGAPPETAGTLPGMADPKLLGQDDEQEATLALLVRMRVPDQPGVLHALTRVISEHHANITYVDIGGRRDGRGATYFELSDVANQDALGRDLEALPIVRVVERELPFGKIYGKRVIVIGVVSLNMAGDVPDAADLLVGDPVQAGVMTVVAVARTATFDVARVRGRRF